MRHETVDWLVPEFLLPALINGDYSGLLSSEEYAVKDLFAQADEIADEDGAVTWHWSVDDDSDYGFHRNHDVAGIGACECALIQQVLMFDEDDGEC